MDDLKNREDEQLDCRVKYIYLPVRDESISMSQFLLSEERREEMERIGAQMRKYLEELPAKDKWRWLDDLALMREGLTPWQITRRRIPLKMRMAYEPCGRLKKRGR